VKLSWLESAYSVMPTFLEVILTTQVGQSELVFGVQPGFIIVYARLQVSVCSSYDLCHGG